MRANRNGKILRYSSKQFIKKCRKIRKLGTFKESLPYYSKPWYSGDVKCNVKRGKEAKKVYTVFDIAKWFLQKQPMEHKKLQKLCYYSQAWSLALKDSKLIDGNFEAWVHGPVNRPLWNRLKNYGYSLIDEKALAGVANNIDEQTALFLEMVWATYKDFNGFQLESLTHQEAPWISAREGLSSCEPSDRIIDNRLMKSYYRNLVSAEGVGE